MTKARTQVSFFYPIVSPMHSDHTHHPAPIRIRDPETQQTATLSDISELSSSSINPLLSLISQTRQRLLDNPSFRAPYVKCLHDLYCAAKSPRVKWHLRQVRRSDLRPTDEDVLEFLIVHWPEVLLTEDPEIFWSVRRIRPRDGAMHLSRGMATQIVEKVRFLATPVQCCLPELTPPGIINPRDGRNFPPRT